MAMKMKYGIFFTAKLNVLVIQRGLGVDGSADVNVSDDPI